MNKPLKKTASSVSQPSGASIYNNQEKYEIIKAKAEVNLKITFKKGTTKLQIAETNSDILRSFVNYLSDLNPVQFFELTYSSKPISKDSADSEFVSITSTFDNAATGGVSTPIGPGVGPHRNVIFYPKIIYGGLSQSSKQIIQGIEEGEENVK